MKSAASGAYRTALRHAGQCRLRSLISGLMATAMGAVSLLAPSVNSYRRVQAFIAVPTHRTWGADNELELVPRCDDLAWSLPEAYEKLPLSITEACDALGADFVDYWVGSRRASDCGSCLVWVPG